VALRAARATTVVRPARRLLATAPTPFEPNVGRFPKFNPKDNSTGHYDRAKHNLETWEHKDIAKAIDESSIFSWGASDALRQTCVHASRSAGIYIYDEHGKRYTDWSAGAVCTNLGHTVPDSIKKAIHDQLNTTAFVYGDVATHDPRARLCALLKDISPGDIDRSLSFFFSYRVSFFFFSVFRTGVFLSLFLFLTGVFLSFLFCFVPVSVSFSPPGVPRRTKPPSAWRVGSRDVPRS
jgi:hypothetical protein